MFNIRQNHIKEGGQRQFHLASISFTIQIDFVNVNILMLSHQCLQNFYLGGDHLIFIDIVIIK